MKRKLLFISLALALVLTALAPATALARGWRPPSKSPVQRFTAVMTPNEIDPTVIGTAWPKRDTPETNVWPIFDLVEGDPTVVGWVVDGRSVYGTVSGDFEGTSTFTYGGILDTLQSGSMEGVLAIQTGQMDVIYLAASGTIVAKVTEYYDFGGIVEWCGGLGLSVGVFFSQIYNNDALALIPGGNLTIADIQAWCTAVGISLVEFFYSIYGDYLPPGLGEATLIAMYGAEDGLPIVSGLELLGGMYGDPMPLLPMTLTAEFKGTLRVDAGTGAYSGVSGQGTFGPSGNIPLTLYVYPNQHVYWIDGAIKLSGTYNTKKPPCPFKVDKDKLHDWMKKWKDRPGDWKGRFDQDWKDRFDRDLKDWDWKDWNRKGP